ncbi:aldo/keto reductase [Streptomyces nodosus]|uniref:aldo/keto reductase n=1 Tax=Streptomyces nodosus TaxID=40318 RepID=UPI0034563DBF
MISTSINPLDRPLLPGNAWEGEEDIFSFAHRHGVATMAYKPLGQGLLTGKYGSASVFLSGDVRSSITTPTLDIARKHLRPLRERFGTDPQDLARIALGCCLRLCPNSIVLAGISDPQQASANFQGLNTELSDADYDFIGAVYAVLREELHRAQELAASRSPSLHPLSLDQMT